VVDLKEFIEEKKINKNDICGILGVSRATLYNWLDEKKPSQSQKIIDAIVQLSNSYIKGLTDNEPSNSNTVNITGNDDNKGVLGSTVGRSYQIHAAPGVGPQGHAGPVSASAPDAIVKLEQEINFLRRENNFLEEKVKFLEEKIKMKDEQLDGYKNK
jgi:hypothetical protein